MLSLYLCTTLEFYVIYSLFNDAINNLEFIASNDRIVDIELERMLKETAVIKFKVLSLNLPSRKQDYYEYHNQVNRYSGRDSNRAPPGLT
jgi:hypothetical protein